MAHWFSAELDAEQDMGPGAADFAQVGRFNPQLQGQADHLAGEATVAARIKQPWDQEEDDETGIAGIIHSFFWRTLDRCSRGKPAEPSLEVIKLLAEMKMTPRQVLQFWRKFRHLKHNDPFSSTATANEVGIKTMMHLVRSERFWVTKIFYLLLDLAGFRENVNWDGFLFVCIHFCRFSKMELCQVMFYIISKGVKSWSVHYLTSTQLDEFFEEWRDCPVPAFSTKNIKFSRLPLAKYRVIDFVELVYRFPPLINPCLHLQRSLQQSLPSLKYWQDMNKIQMVNRHITIDFLRYQKVKSLSDLVTEGVRGKAAERRLALIQQEEQFPDPAESAMAAQLTDTLAGNIPVPLGPLATPKPKVERTKLLPDWLEGLLQTNEDPATRLPLGKANEKEVRWAEMPVVIGPDDPRSVDEAKRLIASTFSEKKRRGPMVSEEDELAKNSAVQKMDNINRAQELEFIRKAREISTPTESMVRVMHRTFKGELIHRPRSGFLARFL